MENLPESPFTDTTLTSFPSLCNTSTSPPSPVVTQQNPLDLGVATPNQLVLLLRDVNLREEVIDQLVKKRGACKDLALLVWNTFNAVFILLQEVIAVYPKLPSMVSMRESTRACNALALFQVMANNPETRRELIKAQIPCYFYPFLFKPGGNDKPLEYLRLTSLGVLGLLTRFDDPYGNEVLDFFMDTEVVHLCLECMDVGDELSSKVATLIVVKILMQPKGMNYCCASAQRFYLIVQVLYRVVEKLSEKPCLLHLKYVIQCYLSLSGVLRFVRPCDALTSQVPPKLFDGTFTDIVRTDPETSRMLYLLHVNIFGYQYFPVNQDSNNIAKPDTTTQKAKGKGKKKK